METRAGTHSRLLTGVQRLSYAYLMQAPAADQVDAWRLQTTFECGHGSPLASPRSDPRQWYL